MNTIFEPEPEGETLARHKRLVEVGEDRVPMEWSDWTLLVPESKCLTPDGKQMVYWATGILQKELLDGFLQKVTAWLKEMQGKGDPDLIPDSHPIFSLSLWGAVNDSPFVYTNLIRLAARIALFLPHGTTQIQSVLKLLRQNPDPVNWLGALLQLEVAALGLRAGWKILLEPPYEHGGKADVRLSNEATMLLVDATTMRMYDVERKALAFYRNLSWQLQVLEFQHNVRISGQVSMVALEQEAIRKQWLKAVEQAAAAITHEGQSQQVPGPGKVVVTVFRPTEATYGESWGVEGEPVQALILERLADVLNYKNMQATGSDAPVWVRIDEFAGLWEFTRLQGYSLEQTLIFYTDFLQTVFPSLPKLAGVILSPGIFLDGNLPPSVPRHERVASQGSIALRCPVPAYHVREILIIPQEDRPASEAQVFADLYEQEDSWLDWALKQLGQPPFSALFSE